MRLLWLQDVHLHERAVLDLCQRHDIERVLLPEIDERYRLLPFHKQKIAFHLSALRHFRLRLNDFQIHVDSFSATTWVDALTRYVDCEFLQLYLVLPNDWRWREALERAVKVVQLMREQAHQTIEVTFIEDDFLFLVPREEWYQLLPVDKTWKMENVYRRLRKHFSVLMNGDEPAGGQWNYDALNRKPADEKMVFAEPLRFEPDDVTKQAIHDVETRFSEHPGATQPFIWPVTADQANHALQHFIDARLADFGEYQDAMLVDEPFMSHSLLAAAINVGLLDVMDVIRAAEQAWRRQHVSLAAAEGFIRQLLGWREYVRGVYICSGPNYAEVNHFRGKRALPPLYWGASTGMRCLSTVVTEVLANSYSHHIQRLMILCNFAVLTSIRPQEVNDWFHQMYIDSQDWVVTPNVLGMGLYADGGRMATKPYISSAQYIKKMSNYCTGCVYRADIRTGDDACPFNSLYWSFIAQHETSLQTNRRMQMMVGTWRRFSDEEKKRILNQAKNVLKRLDLCQL